MVGGGGTPPLAAWLGPDWIRTPGRAPSYSSRCHFSGRRAHTLPYRALSSHAGKCCACDETANQGRPWLLRAEPWHRASVSVGRNLLKTKRYNLRGSAPPWLAPHPPVAKCQRRFARPTYAYKAYPLSSPYLCARARPRGPAAGAGGRGATVSFCFYATLRPRGTHIKQT